MWYHNNLFGDAEPVKLTKESFAKTFTDWDGKKNQLGDFDFDEDFDNLHCCEDPYQLKAFGDLVPLVEVSKEDLMDSYDHLSRQV